VTYMEEDVMLLSLAQLLLYHVLVLMNFLHTDVLKSPFGSVYTFSLLLWIQDIGKFLYEISQFCDHRALC
jgi:hypothetical protein